MLFIAPSVVEQKKTGKSCRAPAVKGKERCRLHGCGKGSGAPRGNKHALKHGKTTAEVKAFRAKIREALHRTRVC